MFFFSFSVFKNIKLFFGCQTCLSDFFFIENRKLFLQTITKQGFTFSTSMDLRSIYIYPSFFSALQHVTCENPLNVSTPIL